MSLADVTKEAILAAVAEFEDLGRDAFLNKYAFGRATAYFLDVGGRLYDSKAIVGVAHGISGGETWRAEEFSGGEDTVAKRLRELGFKVSFLRNPNWTREEIILVCALVSESGWRTVAQEDRRAIELSQLLQSPAIHPVVFRRHDFRNPAGVERKSSDLVSRHPNFRGKPTNGSRLDREVLEDFLRDPVAMHARANAIREALMSWDDQPMASDVVDLDIEAEEGGVLLKLHLRRERDVRLKKSKLAEAKRLGVPIACEACGFDFKRTYGDRGLDYIECHHRTPLAVTGPVTTRLSDLALICSNCHRIIHRRQWITVEELRDIVHKQRAAVRDLA
jgi:5-methylcytosine-specific restriction protein A